MIFIIIYIYSYVYLCIYTPLYQHFKAFSVSKFNFVTSFLYQLFKENSNIIVLKPCQLINEVFLDFHYYLYLFISIFMHLYLYFKYKNFKPCKMFIYVCMYVCMHVCIHFIVWKPCNIFIYVCMDVCRHVCMYIYIYVSQGDFRLMSFTAGRCGTPLIPQRPVT